MRVEKKPQEELPQVSRKYFDEAHQEGVDYFVVVILDYKHPAKVKGQEPAARDISVRLFKTRPYKVLFSRSYQDPAKIKVEDEYSIARNAAKAVMGHLDSK
jgi:hypothetical protein